MSKRASTASSSTSHKSAASVPGGPRGNVILHNSRAVIGNQLPGPLLYTGPDGLRDQRLAVNTPGNSVGVCNSNEHTSELGYLSRAPTDMKFPKAKNGNIGEIGWEVEYFKVKKGI